MATVLHVAQCRKCKEFSGQAEDEIRPAAVWAVEHSRANPDHRHFWLNSRLRWRVEPHTEPLAAPLPDAPNSDPQSPVLPRAPDEPPARCEHGGPSSDGGRSRHALPRPASRTRLPEPVQRAWGVVARYAGLLYVAGLCTAVGAVLVAALAIQRR